MLERLASIIEDALMRHGVPSDKIEGTLDDADAAIAVVIEECAAAVEALAPDSVKPSGVSLNANITIADAVNAIAALSQEQTK